MSLTLEVTALEMREMLRIRNQNLDTELVDLKEAFLSDLNLCGINCIPAGDKLAKSALRLYLRWQENYNGEADRYAEAYKGVKIAMSLAEEYKGGADVEK